MTVRFFMLQSHYSSTLDFSNEALNAAEKGYRRLANALGLIRKMNHSGKPESIDAARSEEFMKLAEGCHLNMSDDFNTAKTIAVLFEMSSRINDIHNGVISLSSIDQEAFQIFSSTYISFMQDVLGFLHEEEGGSNLLDGAIGVLVGIRQRARSERNFALSDKIRDDLKAIGIQLKDNKDGSVSWEANS